MVEETHHGSEGLDIYIGDSEDKSMKEDVAQEELSKLSDSGISSDGQEEEEGTDTEEGGWSWLVVLAG